MALMGPSAERWGGDEDVSRRAAERRAPSEAPEKEAEAAVDFPPRRARLSPGAFALRLVSELIAAAGAWAVEAALQPWREGRALSEVVSGVAFRVVERGDGVLLPPPGVVVVD